MLDGFLVTADDVFGIYLMGSNNIARYCEVDGTGTAIQMAFGSMGSNNTITQCYAAVGCDFSCACKNKTLGGDEGGCTEIINPYGGTTVENVRFHHNYCLESVGLFEACTGSGPEYHPHHHRSSQSSGSSHPRTER